jgi:aminoglycoside/choline kinase family phosphotransferase
MKRQQLLTEWLTGLFPSQPFTIAPASADASFRRYFRATFADRTLIVMDAPPEHENCKPFIHIAQLFGAAGVHVPQILAQDLEQGFLLLTDLDNTTYLQALTTDRSRARELYGAATDALIQIQLASREHELPPYDEALLLREMRLFPEWYVARHLNVTLNTQQNAMLEAVFQRIVQNNLAQPRVYVHRDYHSRNLMVTTPAPLSISLPQAGESANVKGPVLSSPGILDFQDAVYGPITYDLASLFKDAYIYWEEAEVMDWLIRYWEKARKAGLPIQQDFGDFYRDYEWMGVQRHIKVLGIFARLYHRDGKDGYLKDMPLVFAYLHRACSRYIDLKPLQVLLEELHPEAIAEGYSF